MSSFGGTIHRDELLWLYRLPFDAVLVSLSFPSPYDRAALHEEARSLGFNTDTRATVGLGLQKLPLPAAGVLLSTPETNPQPAPDSSSIDQFAAEATDPPPHALVITHNIQGEQQRLCFRIGSQTPETTTTVEAAERLGCELILFASFTIQLVGLTNPFFTQVIIDKFIVYRDRNTLVVFVLALIMFMLFNLTMTWFRHYLGLYAGNRINAVSGSKFFPHLVPSQLKKVIKSLLRKQGQKQQQKNKAKVEPGQFLSC